MRQHVASAGMYLRFHLVVPLLDVALGALVGFLDGEMAPVGLEAVLQRLHFPANPMEGMQEGIHIGSSNPSGQIRGRRFIFPQT